MHKTIKIISVLFAAMIWLVGVSFGAAQHLPFTVGGDWYQRTSQSLGDGTYRVAASVEVSDGLTVFGDMDEDKNYVLGGRVNLTNLFVGSHSRFHHDDGYRGGVFYVGLNEERRRPAVRHLDHIHVEIIVG